MKQRVRLIPKIHESNFWVFSGVILITLLIGAVFCSYLCPLGSVQEWIGALGKRIFKKKYNRFIGRKIDRVLDTRCNRCGACTSVCSQEGSLTYSSGRQQFLPLKNNLVTGVLVLVIFLLRFSLPIVKAISRLHISRLYSVESLLYRI